MLLIIIHYIYVRSLHSTFVQVLYIYNEWILAIQLQFMLSYFDLDRKCNCPFKVKTYHLIVLVQTVSHWL